MTTDQPVTAANVKKLVGADIYEDWKSAVCAGSRNFFRFYGPRSSWHFTGSTLSGTTLGDPGRGIREHKQFLKLGKLALANARREGNAGAIESAEREVRLHERQIQWHRDHPKGY